MTSFLFIQTLPHKTYFSQSFERQQFASISLNWHNSCNLVEVMKEDQKKNICGFVLFRRFVNAQSLGDIGGNNARKEEFMENVRRKSNWRVMLFLLGQIGLTFLLTSNLAGCAPKQRIKVNSQPPGAHVFYKNVVVATTPAVIELNKKEQDVILRLEKKGYEPIDVYLTRSFKGWYIPKMIAASTGVASVSLMKRGSTKAGVISAGVGLLVGTTVGLFYGFSSGDAYKLSPSEVNVVMTELTKQGVRMQDLSKDEIIIVDMESIKK